MGINRISYSMVTIFSVKPDQIDFEENFPGPNSMRLSEKKRKGKNRLKPMDSEVSLTDSQQGDGWHSKAREGVISYPLPDGLPDSSALYTKLQKLMRTDTIHLNDRRFWSKLEHQFKKLRKVLFPIEISSYSSSCWCVFSATAARESRTFTWKSTEIRTRIDIERYSTVYNWRSHQAVC